MPFTAFLPSKHGLPFPNDWPDGLPVVELRTPFGRVGLGNARAGVCGGMVFAALDAFLHGVPRPTRPTPAVFRYLARRLFDSWDLPLGGPRYYAWQVRPAGTRWAAGVPVLPGVGALTAREWPKVRACLDAGMPAPLGLVNVHSWDPRRVGRNHQVLAYGYEESAAAVAVRIYDPNYPNDDALTLTLDRTAPDRGPAVVHGVEGPTCRGFFLTEYRKPALPPAFPDEPALPRPTLRIRG